MGGHDELSSPESYRTLQIREGVPPKIRLPVYGLLGSSEAWKEPGLLETGSFIALWVSENVSLLGSS
jgi:hypothetical protein